MTFRILEKFSTGAIGGSGHVPLQWKKLAVSVDKYESAQFYCLEHWNAYAISQAEHLLSDIKQSF